MAKLEIILLNYKTADMTIDAIKSIYENPPDCSYRLWLVDNASNDGSLEKIRKALPKVKTIANPENSGFAIGNNLAIKKAYPGGEYYLLINTDTIVYKNSLSALVKFADETNHGIVSCYLTNPDGSFQPNCGDLPTIIPMMTWLTGIDDIFKKVINIPSYHQESKKYYVDGKTVGWISGSVFLIKKETIEKIGMLDEKIFMYGEDVEYCWKAKRAGISCGWTDKGKILHIGGASSDKPKLRQWAGEFKGLFYLYKKFYGFVPSLAVRLISYFFIILRAFAFMLMGKFDHAKTYVQVIGII